MRDKRTGPRKVASPKNRADEKSVEPDASSASTDESIWQRANPRIKVSFGLQLSEGLHLKLKYVAGQTAGASMQKIALQAVEEAVEARLKALGVALAALKVR